MTVLSNRFKNIIAVIAAVIFFQSTSYAESWSNLAEVVSENTTVRVNFVRVWGEAVYFTQSDKLIIKNNNTKERDISKKLSLSAVNISDVIFDNTNEVVWLEYNSSYDSLTCHQRNFNEEHCDLKVNPSNSAIKKWDDIYTESSEKGSLGALDYNDKYAALSFFKGDSYLYDMESKVFRIIYKPSVDVAWPREVAISNKYVFLVIDEGIFVYSIDGEKTSLLENTKNKAISIDANEEYLFVGSLGLNVIKLSDINNLMN
jgi:hypothetical protein